jgi:hypothetical protein
MPERTAEPLSPELILVSPPEEAALAREQLPDPPQPLRREVRRESQNGVHSDASEPISRDPSEATWNDFLADVRSRPVEPVARAAQVPRPPVRIRRNGRKRLLVAMVALAAVGAVVGLGWARDRAHEKPGSSASSTPAPPRSHAPAPPRSHAPAVTTAPKPKPKTSSKPEPRPRHAAGFVPTRVWSWAADPGAGAYVVRFLREGHKVLKIRTGSARLRVPSSFTFTPGHYRWTVTAIPRNGKGAHVIVNSAFTVG